MTDTVEEQLGRQKRCLELLINFQTNTSKQKAAAAMTVEDYNSRLDVLEAYGAEFRERDCQLNPMAATLRDRSYFKVGYYDQALSAFLSAKAWLHARLTAYKPPPVIAPAAVTSGNAPTQSSQASLERVKLPKFSGAQRVWQGFKSKFQSLIFRDVSMPTIIKFEHLMNSLEGKAAEKLNSFDLIEENFATAWEALYSRYDNSLLRFSTHFKALLRLPASTKESGEHLSQHLHTALAIKNVFTALNLPVQHWDMIFIQFLENRLPSSTRLEWTRSVKGADNSAFPKFADFKSFLEARIQSLDIVGNGDAFDTFDQGGSDKTQFKSNTGASKKVKPAVFKSVSAHMTTQESKKFKNTDICSFCQGNHFINVCRKFTALVPAKRKEHAITAKLCINCLSARLKVDACTAKGSCCVCGSRHHSKLHSDDQINHATGSRTSGTGGQHSAVHFTASESAQPAVEPCGNQQLLATAIVVLQSEEGVRITARALLDSCAERSFVSEYIAQALALKRNPITLAISGLNGTTSAIARGEVQLTLKSLINPNFNLDVTALVVKRVSNLLPRDRVVPGDWAHIQGLQLADPHFGRRSRVDCILSSAVYGAVMLLEIRRGQQPHLGPVAMSSIFGWILVGNAGPGQPTTSTTVHHLAVDHSLSEAIAKFWESEEVPQDQRRTPPP